MSGGTVKAIIERQRRLAPQCGPGYARSTLSAGLTPLRGGRVQTRLLQFLRNGKIVRMPSRATPTS